MAHVSPWDWAFEHGQAHHADTPQSAQQDNFSDTAHLPQTDSVASVIKNLWHHDNLMSGGANVDSPGKSILPALMVGNSAITVDAGGSVTLPITVSPGSGHATSVTISGLASYESVTDGLDHHTFTGDSITLSAAQVNSGLSLASTYTGTDHPVNQLTVTAGETIGHHTLTSAQQTIVVTDPPVSGTGGNPLTLQVSGDMYNGDPKIQVFVDGQQVGGTYDISAHHSLGQTQTIQIAGTFDPTVAHQVQVKFINDAWDGTSAADGHDRNVYVDSISLNGATINGAQGTGQVGYTGTEAVMYSNGTLAFAVPAEPPAGGGTGTGTGTGTGGGTGTGTGTGSGTGSGRDWAFIINEGGEPGNWASVNSGWSLQPMDGLHTQTDIGSGFWFATGKQWSPTPHTLMMTDQYGTPGTNYIDMGQAAKGAYNSTWLSWLEADAAAAPAPVKVVRIWPEINGDWFPWSVNQTGATSVDGTPNGSPWPAATIIAAFQNMAEQVRTAMPNAVIEWNLAAGGPWSGPSGPGNGTGLDLYPGDRYVDVIGIDAYEKNLSWASTVSGSGVNLNNEVALATAHNKLVGISETAAHNGDASYITSMTNYFDGLGTRAAYISYYDQGLANNGDNIIYSATGTDSAPALRDALNASSFGTKPYVGTL